MPRRAHLGLIAAAAFAVGLQGSAGHLVPAGFVAATRFVLDDPLSGGWSGIEIAPDGSRFVALSDRGAFVEGSLARDAGGAITGITAGPVTRLKATGDAPLKPGRADSEGIAWAPDGTVYVSFEGVARVLRYARITGPATNLPRPDAFRRLQSNASFEALAVDALGRVYTLPERSGDLTRPFPVWRFDGEWTDDLSIPRDGDYLPVAADFGPDGRFYLLERNFQGLGGFSSRVRVFDLGETGFGPGETVLETAFGEHDNLEGLSVWQDAQGAIRLTMVSDDNFKFYLRSQIVEYRLLPVTGALTGG